MSCCAAVPPPVEDAATSVENDDAALLSLSRRLGDHGRQLEFAVPDAHCAACIQSIETALLALPQVETARVNLSKRRVRVVFDPDRGAPSAIAPAIRRSGYHTYLIETDADGRGDPILTELVRAMAVAGFAAGNIMLFSVAIWSGANEATRDLFHWISALIALPAIAYAGLPFFRSAWRAVRVGRTNMDVPISIGVLLATALSLYETSISGAHAYFDASTTLLFFLLVGRTLDHLMRERARNAIANLARLTPSGATRLDDDGRREHVPLAEVAPGMVIEVRAGERVPVDATLLAPTGAFDYAIVTGESTPHEAVAGAEILAGATNLAQVVTLQVLRPSADSFLARMAAMMDAAEGARSNRRQLADRAAAVYAPVVHTVAAMTFAGWGIVTGDWHAALMNAVAVLIITCPCALALAVPIVLVVAAGKLFSRGVLMKDGAALERAAEITGVAFDKTGTLTEGSPALIARWVASSDALDVAAAMARSSTHPLSRTLASELGESEPVSAEITEFPGTGMEAHVGATTWRMGSAAWCGVSEGEHVAGTQVWLTRDGEPVCWFRFDDAARADAASTVAELEALGLSASLLSGDREDAVAALAEKVGIATWRAGLMPEEKVNAVRAMGRAMMVGDGINDAPALRAAHVSMAPASATDIGRSAADFVFTGGRLEAVPYVITIARRAGRLINENLAFAIAYNAVAVPLAICGLVTPLIAAVAMSLSSIIVVLNAMRLHWDGFAPALPRLRRELATTTVAVQP